MKIGDKYRHFKGHLYEVVLIAKDSETLKDIVVYKDTESDKIWTREMDMFLSKVDKEKYPEVLQEYRFERIND